MNIRRNRALSITTRIVVSLALLIIGIGIYILLTATRDPGVAVAPPQPAMRLAVMEAHPVEVRRQWQGFGTAAPAPGNAANVPAQVRGIVIDVPREVVVGASVTRGQVLVRLDPTDFEHEVAIINDRMAEVDAQIVQLSIELESVQRRLELAVEEVEIAEADLARVLSAFERGAALQREVDQQRQMRSSAVRAEVAAREQLEQIEPRRRQLRAMHDQLRTSLRIAERNLDRTTIVSPIDGILQLVDVEPGEAVSVDQRIARVVSIRRMEVPLRLPAGARADLMPGAPAILRSAGSAKHEWRATVSRVAPEDDQQTRTVAVYVELEQDPESPNILAPGQFVRGTVTAGRSQERWVVPRRAIQGDRVRMVVDGAVRSTRVNTDYQVQQHLPELGIDETLWAVLRDPLPDRALIVLDGTRRITEGTAAEPVIINDDAAAILADRDGR